MRRAYIPIWLALITGLSLAPFSLKDRFSTMGRFHAVGHLALFAVTAAIFVVAFGRRASAIKYLALASVPFVLEWLEVAVYHPSFEWTDVATDLAGITFGLAVYASLRRLKGPDAH